MILGRLTSLFAIMLGSLLALGTAAHGEESSYSMQQQQGAVRKFIVENFNAIPPNFQALESLARDVNVKVSNNQNYSRALGDYYRFLAKISGDPAALATLLEWRLLSPKSPVPILAELSSRAMFAAGNLSRAMSRRDVWNERAESRDELAKVYADLQRLKSIAAEDPYWYVLMAEVKTALRHEPTEMLALVSEGLKKHPGNYELVLVATSAALSKWYAEPLDLDVWARHVHSVSSAADRGANYARVYIAAYQLQYGAQLFELAPVDWEQLMHGLRQLVITHPSDLTMSQAAVLSCLGGNRTLTRDILTDKRFEYNEYVWYDVTTPVQAYEPCLSWATQKQSAKLDGNEPSVPISAP